GGCGTVLGVLVFFHAEDGIRDFHVTGVQTCALPISAPVVLADEFVRRRPFFLQKSRFPGIGGGSEIRGRHRQGDFRPLAEGAPRSEERRVGKEWRRRWAASAPNENTAACHEK